MRELVDGWPYAAVFALFFASGMARSHLTYWAGRGLRHGGGRSRLAGHLDRPVVKRAEAGFRESVGSRRDREAYSAPTPSATC